MIGHLFLNNAYGLLKHQKKALLPLETLKKLSNISKFSDAFYGDLINYFLMKIDKMYGNT